MSAFLAITLHRCSQSLAQSKFGKPAPAGRVRSEVGIEPRFYPAPNKKISLDRFDAIPNPLKLFRTICCGILVSDEAAAKTTEDTRHAACNLSAAYPYVALVRTFAGLSSRPSFHRKRR